MKECIICKKLFIPRTINYKCCSKECSRINRINYEHSGARIKSRDARLKLYEQTERRKQYRANYEATAYRKNLKKAYEHCEKRKAYHRVWEKSNKRKVYLAGWRRTPAGGKRRANKNNILERFTKDEWNEKIRSTQNFCPHCHMPFDNGKHKLNKDHIFPISMASNEFKLTGIKRVYTIDDVQPLCQSCNSSKGNKILKVEC